jgi:uncharacterized membrane protein YdjX (TVP38/TMEM64 family)
VKQLRLVALAAGIVVASKLLVENLLGIDVEGLATSWLDDAGPGTAATIVLLLASDVLLPVPSSLVMVLSGAAFGVVWGSLLSLVGSVAGEWLGFELVKTFRQRVSTPLVGDDEVRRLEAFFERYGAVAVIATRPVPIVMETVSMIAGLSRMNRRTFLAASVVGTAPIGVLYAYAGAISQTAGTLLPALVIVVSVGAAGWLWYRTRFGLV